MYGPSLEPPLRSSVTEMLESKATVGPLVDGIVEVDVPIKKKILICMQKLIPFCKINPDKIILWPTKGVYWFEINRANYQQHSMQKILSNILMASAEPLNLRSL